MNCKKLKTRAFSKFLWFQSFFFFFHEASWGTRNRYFWKCWLKYIMLQKLIFVLMGNSRRPKRLYTLKEWRSHGGISGIEKVRKVMKRRRNYFGMVWCMQPDNTDPSSDLMEVHSKSSHLAACCCEVDSSWIVLLFTAFMLSLVPPLLCFRAELLPCETS